jgi:hypothetical protein
LEEYRYWRGLALDPAVRDLFARFPIEPSL